ncbi:hypothetical protein NQZ68_002609 [Dissostichus eleginoides]|nr:hypothetical protein NQZ68_002609 [Dissostichus eleginoides]
MEKIVNLAEMLRLEITDYLLPALKIQSLYRGQEVMLGRGNSEKPNLRNTVEAFDTESRTQRALRARGKMGHH